MKNPMLLILGLFAVYVLVKGQATDYLGLALSGRSKVHNASPQGSPYFPPSQGGTGTIDPMFQNQNFTPNLSNPGLQQELAASQSGGGTVAGLSGLTSTIGQLAPLAMML